MGITDMRFAARDGMAECFCGVQGDPFALEQGWVDFEIGFPPFLKAALIYNCHSANGRGYNCRPVELHCSANSEDNFHRNRKCASERVDYTGLGLKAGARLR